MRTHTSLPNRCVGCGFDGGVVVAYRASATVCNGRVLHKKHEGAVVLSSTAGIILKSYRVQGLFGKLLCWPLDNVQRFARLLCVKIAKNKNGEGTEIVNRHVRTAVQEKGT